MSQRLGVLAHFTCTAIAATCFALLVECHVMAATKFWKDSVPVGAFSTSTNWSAVSAAGTDNGGAPLASEPALIVHTSGVAHTVTVFGSTPSLGLLSIDLTGAGATTNTLTISNNVTLTAASIFVGGHNGGSLTNGRGAVNQSNGTVTTSAGSDLYLGLGAGSTGVYNLSGGSLNANLSTVVGSLGTATFNHSGGTHTLVADLIGGALLVGYQAGSNGTYNLSGTGQLISNKNEYIGVDGVGQFFQTGGTNTVSGAKDLVLGYNASGNGTYTLSGGTLLLNQSLHVGLQGNGTFTQTGGTNTINAGGGGAMIIGNIAGSSGTYNLSGTGQLVTNGSAYVGNNGTGIFNHTGGVNTLTGTSSLFIANTSSSVGTYTASGAAALNVGGDVNVGHPNNSASGTLNVQGNANVNITGALNIGALDTVNLSGGTLRFSAYNRNPFGAFNYTGGKIQLSGDRTIGTDPIITELFGASPVIPSGKELAIEGTGGNTAINITSNVGVDGGKLSVLNSLGILVGSTGGPRTLSVTNGGTVNVNGGAQSENDATILVDGPGSSITASGPFFIGTTTSNGSMTISGGGSVTTGGNGWCRGVCTIAGTGSTWTVDDLFVSDGGVLTIENNALVSVDPVFDLVIFDGGITYLNGGTLRTRNIVIDNGAFVFNSGTIEATGDRTIGSDQFITTYYGTSPVLEAGKGLGVVGVATLLQPLVIDGGTFSAGQLVNGSNLTLQRGTLNITNQAVTIGAGGPLGSTLDLNDDMTVNVTQGITNQGLVTGDGQIGGQFINATVGELRASAGKSLKFTGAIGSYGQIKLLGGELESTEHIANAAGALISGNGTIITRLGLFNPGTMNFAGTANIVGDVTNDLGGRIISGGGGATIFYDDVVNNGEIRTSANGFTVFFGSTSGSGTFTGTGTVNFEGDLKPGSSPAAVSFGGDVSFGVDASLEIEIGGLTAGSQHDKLSIAGDLALDGALEVMLINSFNPIAGQTFNILDWLGTRSGTFSSLALPTLAGLAWDTSTLYSDGILRVASVDLPGDFNHDGAVDAADYIAWRKGAGVATTTPNYNLWHTNFGRTTGGGGAAAPGSAAVPEPNGISVCLLALLIILATRGNRSVAKNRC